MSVYDSAVDSDKDIYVRSRRRSRSKSPIWRRSYRSPIGRERSRPSTSAGFYEDWVEEDPASRNYWARPSRPPRQSPPHSTVDPEDRLYREYVRSAEERLRAALSADKTYDGSQTPHFRDPLGERRSGPGTYPWGSRVGDSPDRREPAYAREPVRRYDERRDRDDADRVSSYSRREQREGCYRTESIRAPLRPASLNKVHDDEYSGGVYTAGSNSSASDGESEGGSRRAWRESFSRNRNHESAEKPQKEPLKLLIKPPRTVPSEWREPKWILPDGSITELVSIHSAEFQIDKSGKERVVLVCPNRPQTQGQQEEEDGSRVQMKWLHIQSTNPNLNVLSKLVLDCPFISLELRKAALGVLEDLSQVKGGYKDSGVVATNEKATDTSNERVLFLSMLHLKLCPKLKRTKDKYDDMNSLLEFFYSDDVDLDRESKQVVRRMNVGSSNDSLHVATLWCLLLGSNLLITFASMPRSEACGDLIEIDSRSTRGFYTVPVEYRPGLRHNIVIEPDCTYVDFLRQAVALCTGGSPDARDYELVMDEENGRVTPSKWLQLLSSEMVEKKTLRLVPVGFLSQSRMSYYGSARGRSQSRRSSVRSPFAPSFGTHPLSPVRRTNSFYSEVDSRAADSPRFKRHYRGYSPPPPPLPMSDYSRRVRTVRISKSSDDDEPVVIRIRRADKVRYRYNPGTRRSSAHSTGLSTNFSSSAYVKPTSLYKYGRLPHERLLEAPRQSQSPDSKIENWVKENEHLEPHEGSGEIPMSRQGPLFARYPPPPLQKDDDGIRVYPMPGLGNVRTIPRSQTQSTDQSSRSSQPKGYSRERRRVRATAFSDSDSDGPLRRYIRYASPPPLHQNPERERRGSSYTGTHRRVHFNQRESVRERSVSPAPSVSEYQSLETMGITTIPFFTWRLKSSKEQLTLEETDTTLFRILGKIHKSLQRDKSGRYYDKTYKCTMERVLRRYSEMMIQETTAPIPGNDKEGGTSGLEETPEGSAPILESPSTLVEQSVQTTVGARGSLVSSNGSTTQKGKLLLSALASSFSDDIFGALKKPSAVDSAASIQLSPGASTDHEPTMSDDKATECDDNGTPSRQSTLGTTDDALAQHHAVVRRFIQQSQTLLWAFLPKEGSSQIHQVCARFWGAVDEIIRHFLWSASQNVPGQKWVVRDLDNRSPVAEKTKFEDCSSCKVGKRYSNASQALKHLHTEHIDCPHARRNSARPSEDPCFAWLRPTTPWNSGGSMLLWSLEQFIGHVVEFSKATNEVHSLLATYQQPEEGKLQRPLLPSNLVHAFEEIVIAYILTANDFLTNSKFQEATDMIERKNYATRMSELARRIAASIDSAHDLLELAKRDIILAGSVSREMGSLGLYVIRPEFLVAALTTVVQDRPLEAESKTAVVDLYEEYTSKLQYQANRRPQRRVFLDVHNLEEELEALQSILQKQRDRVAWYLDSIKPRLSLLEEDPRHEFYCIEERYGRKQLRKLLDRTDDLSRLQGRCKALKEQVKQTLEILEEDHGKAIWVFTIVTLFFLPLSFVTGFLGMNTSDIRDMDNDQTLFWTVAIPVTAIVLSIAFVYGYKGYDIADWLSTALRSRRRRFVDKKRDLTLNTATTVSTVERGPSAEKESAILPRSWRGYGRRKRSKSAIIRRKTNDSSFS